MEKATLTALGWGPQQERYLCSTKPAIAAAGGVTGTVQIKAPIPVLLRPQAPEFRRHRYRHRPQDREQAQEVPLLASRVRPRRS